MNSNRHGPAPLLAAAAGVLAAAFGTAFVAAPTAAAASARVAVAPTAADPGYATTLTVSGTGFQSVKGGFGGIYVLFGVVDGTWRPSRGGEAGKDYAYVPDSQAKDNSGFQKFVSFPGGSTLSEANGGVISAGGSWRTTLVVPGARFTAAGAGGGGRKVDCTREQCGVITIGAHGVANANNETFTPVAFKAQKKAAPGSTPRTAPGTTPPPATARAAGPPSQAAPSALPTSAAPPGSDAASAGSPGHAPARGPATASHTSTADTADSAGSRGLRLAGIALAAAALVAGLAAGARRLRARRPH